MSTEIVPVDQEESLVDSILVNDSGEYHVKVRCKLDHCDVARQVIRSALLIWGVGWLSLTPAQRRAELALAAVEIYSGFCQFRGKEWKRFAKQSWTARDCMEVIRICRDWSRDGSYGRNLISMSAEDPKWESDPIPALKRYTR